MAKTKLVFKQDYGNIKKGTVVEADEVTSSVFTTTVNRKRMVIPITFVDVAPGSAVPSGFNATMSAADASKLSADMGFKGSAFGNLDSNGDPIPEPEPEPPKPRPKLEENQIWLSDITKGRLPESGVDHIITRNPDTLWSAGQLNDVPERDDMYCWNPDLLEALWMAYKHNKKILLTGWPGTGKTTGAMQFASWINHPVMRFNGKDGIEASSFLGYVWATKSGMEWRDGLMPQGVREGYIVLIDEVMKIPSGIQMALQNLYEEKGYLMLDDKPGTVEEKKVIPAPSFRMILTDNAKGTGDNFDKFAGTQVQDTSTIDRFGITAEVPYLPSVDETAMLAMKYPAMPVDEIARIVQFANLVRNGYIQSSLSLTLSPRGLQTICELFADIPNVPQCVKMTYLSKLGDTEEQDAVHEMFKTIW